MKKNTRWTIGGAAAVLVLGGGAGVAVATAGDDEDARPDVAITGDALEQAGEAALAHLGEGEVTDTEVGDEEGYYEVEVTLDDGGQVDVHLDEDFAVLGDERDGDEDGTEVAEDDAGEEGQVAGPDRDEAGAAALEAAGPGTVTEVEVADEGDTGYEVEVRLDDGSFVEVALDESFAVVSVEQDDD